MTARLSRVLPIVVLAVGLTGCAASSKSATNSNTAAVAAGGSVAAGSGAAGSSGASAAGSADTPVASSSGACAAQSLPVLTKGTLTVATDNPAYEPWFSDNKPTNGKGFESAVGYAVAKQLGFQPDQVKWVSASFNSVIAPGKKKFDFDINEVSITDERKKAVDFSAGYYDVAQAVITVKGSKIAGATSLAALKGAKLGAQIGTTSYTTITEVLKPSAKPAVYDTNDLAVQALKNKQIDGLVVDLPTGFYITGVELDNGVIVGQLPGTGVPEQFGLVLSKGSPLTNCVAQAVEILRGAGTLTALQKQWLATAGNAPELK